MNCNVQNLAQQAACWISCISAGNAGAVRNFILCQIANTSKFGGGGGAGLPLLTNFSFFPGPGNLAAIANATWDIPPAAATGTEIWTSPDNITFTLLTTVPAPGTSDTLIAAPAVGSFKWAKARWVNASSQGPFCAVQEVSGRVCDWAHRVIANGAGVTAQATRIAMNTFDLAIVAGALDSHIYTLSTVVPDSLTASLTPLYKAQGSDPYSGDWAASGSTVGIGANGWTFPSANSGVGTGAIPSNFFTTGNGGVSFYAYNNTSDASIPSAGASVNAAANQMQSYCNQAGTFFQSMFAQDAAFLGVALPSNPFTGYLSANRVSTTDIRLFGANSTTAHGQIGATNANANAATPPTVAFTVFDVNNNGAPTAGTTGKTFSYFSLHDGFTQAQSLAEFNAVQTLRTALGGGFR